MVVNIDGFATSATPGEDLPSGVLFWRAGDPSTGAYSSTRVFAVNRVVSASGSVTGTLHDVDGDGLADVVVGAPGGSLVSLWRGRRGATPDAPVSIHRASPAGFGARVGLAGDLHGEGGGELVVGGNEDEWTPLGSTVRFREGSFDEPHVDEFRGDSVVGVGDVDADGFDDLIARNRHWVRIDVFHGYSIGLSLDSHDFWPAPSTDDAVSLAPAWDVNHDEHDEVLVGVPWRAGGTGVAHVVGYGMPSAGSIMLPPPLGVTGFGARVAALGDIDGDGLSDALVEARAPRFRAYVYRASSLTEAPQAIEGPAGSVVRVVAVGDVDGDGYADALLPLPSSSRALLYRGSVGGFVTSPLAIEGPEWARATGPVVGTGDVDGDGFDDVAVGDPLRGIVRLYFGDATRPLIRQTTLTGSADEGFGAALALNDSSTASAPNSTRRAWWG